MKRREFSLACGLALSTGAWAQAGNKPRAGEEYLVLDKPAPVDTPAGKIEVIEFFWYSCPHCNAFEPVFDAWAKRVPKDVVVRRVPVAFNDSFAPQQRLFYTLEAMGLLDKLHIKVFHAIHVERQRLDTPTAIAEWAAKQGVDKAKFQDQYNSFSAASKASRATQLQNAYKVEGVPALGIGGRYYTDGSHTGNMQRALQVTDYLIASLRGRVV